MNGCAVIVDIDGVLADGYPALHSATSGGATDWDLYHDLMIDAPLLDNGIADLVRTLHDDTDIAVVLLTCRGDHKQATTRKWLDAREIPFDELIHKPLGVEHYEHKRIEVERLRSFGFGIVLAIDDDPEWIRIYREMLVPTLYIHSGHYDARQPWREQRQLLSER
jgi:uncharacterized HAD superfamily protein